jgi:hypothetical protein
MPAAIYFGKGNAHEEAQNRGRSGSTELKIVVSGRSWREISFEQRRINSGWGAIPETFFVRTSQGRFSSARARARAGEGRGDTATAGAEALRRWQ